MKLAVVKKQDYLVPIADYDFEKFRYVRSGECFEVDIKKMRNPRFHRKMFALLKFLLDNTDKYDNIDDLLTELKLQTGHYQEHITTGGKLIYIPKSIAFHRMDDIEFAEFYEKSMRFICAHWLPSMTQDQIEQVIRF